MLQETHLLEKDENFIRSGWGFDCFLAGSDSNNYKNGVGIFFGNNFEHKVHNIVRDPNGCFLILDVELLKKRVTIVNVYGPSEADRPVFFEGVFVHVEALKGA